MSKVIDFNQVWYHEVAPMSYYLEDDLERSILQNLEIIFPEYAALLFKTTLRDSVRLKNNIADLAMIKMDYSEWHVIEVELGKHDKQHVLEQVESFYNCSYSDEHAEYIHRKRPDLDLGRLKNMIASNAPQLMVIVNEPKPDWIKDLRNLNCKACIFQIYHDFRGNTIYRINGEHPYIKIDFCHCRYQKSLPYTIEVLNNHGMLTNQGLLDGTSIDIEFNGLVYKWKREDSGKRVFLICSSARPPLDPLRSTYRLNFNRSVLKIQQTRGWWKKVIRKIKRQPSQAIVTTFSFSKD